MCTGDQKSNKPAGQSPSFYLLIAYIRSYHLFNIWEKHVTKVFCCFYRKLCWQIINGTHQNTRAFNAERENTAPLNNFSFILVISHLSKLFSMMIFNTLFHCTKYKGMQNELKAISPVMNNMLISIIHTKWTVNCCTLRHKFYRSSSVC